MQDGDAVSKIHKRERPITIEPSVDLPFRRDPRCGLVHLRFRRDVRSLYVRLTQVTMPPMTIPKIMSMMPEIRRI